MEAPEPPEADGPVLVRTRAIGVCGTDREILGGRYGWAPPGRERLILGHESLGEVLSAPAGSGFAPGDRVVGVVRRPDPVPCPSCAVGEWDMCRNGRYTERGIKERDGFGSERYRIRPEFLVRVDPALGDVAVLVETTSVVAKAWEQVERIGARAARWTPRRALITGAGPVGLMAALLSVQRGLETHVTDRMAEGLKPALVRALGARYHLATDLRELPEPDVIIECTGVSQVVWEAMNHLGPGGILCLAGVSSGGRTLAADVGALNRELVLENQVVFGSVNANRRHYEQAASALARADRAWLERVITRRVPLPRWAEAVERHGDDVKNVIRYGED